MNENLYPNFRELGHPGGLDIRLKEINTFINSIQKWKDI